MIAEHMTRAQSIPSVTWVEECDFGNVDLKRLVPRVLEAVAASLQEFPELNARLEGDEIVFSERYDLGVAIDTEQGLVVPVVRDCDSRSLDELDAEVTRLAEARAAGDAEAGGAARLDVHGHERGQVLGLVRDAADQPPGGRHPRHPPDRRAARRARRPDRRAPDRARVGHVRPPRVGREARRRVRARRDLAPGTRRGPARPGPPASDRPRTSLVVRVVQLAADLAAGPLRAVDVRVRLACADRRQDLVELVRLRFPGRSGRRRHWRQPCR